MHAAIYHKRVRHGNVRRMAPINNISQYIDEVVSSNKVVVFSKTWCNFSKTVKGLFDSLAVTYKAVELDEIEGGKLEQDFQEELLKKTGLRTVPNVFINGSHYGDCTKTLNAHNEGILTRAMEDKTHNYEYDLIVIGGGSGGLAAAKEAGRFGKKVAVCDFVKPTPIGTTWGLGGTCVNVGCIPKKLMHQASILGQSIEDSKTYGWELPEKSTHDWGKMVEGIQNHIGSLNWGYRVALRNKQVTYLNAFAHFLNPHTIQTVNKKGIEKTVTADKFVLAMGGRPRYPDIPGAKEYGITSDDLFSLSYNPGKTLLIGASYISLECAGFLHGIGIDTTIMVRSILLRGFDRQMSELAGQHMENLGVKFIRECVPNQIELIEEGKPGRLKVTAEFVQSKEKHEEEFNTVIFAIGRDGCTKDIGLEKIGVKLNPKNGKVVCGPNEQTSVPNIYAVGDILDGGLELTPVAIQAGKLLARRLFDDSKVLTDYINVPTTVFTPLEYACVGYSEDDSIAQFGRDDIEVYHGRFWPLEFSVPKRDETACYAKIVCKKSDNDKIIGMHYLGPNAGEVIQGYAIALKLGATKHDVDMLVGIHPTTAEVFTTLSITKSSGDDISIGGC